MSRCQMLGEVRPRVSAQWRGEQHVARVKSEFGRLDRFHVQANAKCAGNFQDGRKTGVAILT